MAGITWLHLSDWHQRGQEFDRMVVRDALIEDIRHRDEISQDLAQIDFIVFSGDVAHSGKKEEYDTAIQEFFDPVLEATGLKEDRNKRLFIVPGNHDLNRDKFELLPEALKQPLKDHSQVQQWQTNDEKRSFLLNPFKEYREFVNEYTRQQTPDYVNILPLEIAGKKVALLGINSALMAGRNKDKHDKVDDYGKLIVGEPQIHYALNQLENYDLRIAVLHHPLEWLSEFDQRRVRMLLVKKCHFILCGHQHEPEFYQVQELDGNYLMIPAGATYETGEHPNSYNFVHLDFENYESKIYLRCWSNKRREWISDHDTSPEGEYTFRLPIKNSKSQQVSLPNYPQLANKLIKKYQDLKDWKKEHKDWQEICLEIITAQESIQKFSEGTVSNFLIFQRYWKLILNDTTDLFKEFPKFYRDRINNEDASVSKTTVDELVGKVEEMATKITKINRSTYVYTVKEIVGVMPNKWKEKQTQDDLVKNLNTQEAKRFDVFLSHNSRQKEAVRQLARELKARKLKVWLDEWELAPGRPWQKALEKIISTTKSAIVLVGKDGLGPWEESKMRDCLNEFVKSELPVIPVLLPGAADKKPDLPDFLQGFTWVDLRDGITDERLNQLQWGITGQQLGDSEQLPSNVSDLYYKEKEDESSKFVELRRQLRELKDYKILLAENENFLNQLVEANREDKNQIDKALKEKEINWTIHLNIEFQELVSIANKILTFIDKELDSSIKSFEERLKKWNEI